MFFYFYSVFSYSEPDWSDDYFVVLDDHGDYRALTCKYAVKSDEQLDPDDEQFLYYDFLSAGPYPHFTKKFPRETYTPFTQVPF